MKCRYINNYPRPLLVVPSRDRFHKPKNDSDVLSLFESLDGHIEFKDPHRVQKALELNDPEKKAENQIRE